MKGELETFWKESAVAHDPDVSWGGGGIDDMHVEIPTGNFQSTSHELYRYTILLDPICLLNTICDFIVSNLRERLSASFSL
jgi:hypothetical protein